MLVRGIVVVMVMVMVVSGLCVYRQEKYSATGIYIYLYDTSL